MEPVFGIIKRVMGWSQMSISGPDNARDEWSLLTMTWNIDRRHVLRAAKKSGASAPNDQKAQPCNAS